MPSSYDDWKLREPERGAAEHHTGLCLKSRFLPGCDWCGEPVYDDYYHDIAGDGVCGTCIENTKKPAKGAFAYV